MTKTASQIYLGEPPLGEIAPDPFEIVTFLESLQDSVATGLLPAATWVELQTLTFGEGILGGTVNDSDTGTHLQATATGYDGVSVPNAGTYRYVAEWDRLKWTGDTGLAGKSNVGHGHAVEDVVGLQGELDAKADGAATTAALNKRYRDAFSGVTNFVYDGANFSVSLTGAPEAVADLAAGAEVSFADDETVGKVLRITHDGSGNTYVCTKKTIPFVAGHTYEATAILRVNVADGGTVPIYLQTFRLDADFLSPASLGTTSTTLAVTGDFVTVSVVATASGTFDDYKWLRARLGFMETAAGDQIDVLAFYIEDVTAVSTKANQTEVDALTSKVNALDSALVLQGDWDASVGTFPGAGAAQKGYVWIVSVAGTVDGVDFQIGDRVTAITADASTTTFAANWIHEDYTDRVSKVSGKTGDVVLDKDDVGLDQVDNTPDSEKPVSTPQQEALNAKANQDDLVETDAALDDAALSARLARVASSGILTGPGTVGNALSGAKHPWLHLVQSLALAVADDVDGNLGFGVEGDGTVWLSVLKLLGSLQTETFSVNRAASEHAFALEDAGGNLALAVTRIGELLVSGGAQIGGQTDWDFVVVDPNDNVGFGIKDSLLYLPQNVTAAVDVKALDSRNKAQSLALREGIVQSVQLPTADYNTLANDGQSLGEGNETWPSLSKTPVAGALMLGDNVDNLSGADTYDVLGTLQFNPLVANTHDGTKNLSGVEEAALTPGDQAKGEPPVIGLANGLKLALNRRALSENDGRNLVAISPAIGGKTIEQLSKVNTHDAVDRYSILTDGVTKVEALAGSDSHVVTVVSWMQGEYNYRDQGASWDKASYKTLMHQLFDDIGADVIAITGQSLPPLFMTYQTGATYTRDIDSGGNAGLHVGMAQLEVATERPDTVMVGPVYPYTDKGGHLDANGARWYGLQQAKVARKVLIEGEPWEPVRPLEIAVNGVDVHISFHVPVAPLVFDLPYVTSTATDYADNGFRVTSADGATVYPISDVEIVADTVVHLRLASTPPSDALVWYADKTAHDGNGNLRDSDPTKAHERYEYVPERGMYAAANIPALVDKNYPLHNWCVAFCLPLNYSEFF